MERITAYGNRTEAVGLFHSAEDMQAAVDDLLSNGFDRMDLSVLASEQAVEEKLGMSYLSTRDLEDRPDVPTTAFVPKETLGDEQGAVIGAFIYLPAVIGTMAVVATGGTAAAAIAAAILGAGLGGTFGGVLATILGDRYAKQIDEHLKHGGLLLWVRTRDLQHEERALAIMSGHDAQDVHLHELPAFQSEAA